jgi:glycosyltransferase involved in cell wall biosynthesis
MTHDPRIVVFSTLFPNEAQPQSGLFVRERMFRVAQALPVTVVAPVPWFPLQSLVRRWRPHFRPDPPRREVQDGIEVLHPRFFSFPGLLKRLDGIFLAAASLETLLRLKRGGRLDVLDAHFAYPDGYAAALVGRWLGVPVTITLRGTEARHARTPRLGKLVRKALESARRVFSVSESLKRIAVGLGIPEQKILVVANGVDTAKFRPLPRAEARSLLGLPPDAPVLVSVGALVERKGFHRVIDCLPALRSALPDLRYLVVGGPSPEGDWRGRLEAQVAALGLADCVRFLGPLPPDELRVPLSAGDVFALATRNEGWANVFLEAMACGLPVVTTDVGGNAEVVCRDDLGTLAPFGDQPALERALRAALERAWDRDAIIAFAQRNSWQGRVEILVQEFRHLGADRGAPAFPASRPAHEPARAPRPQGLRGAPGREAAGRQGDSSWRAE